MNYDICRCKLYNFPHRLGGGMCVGNLPGPFCEDCGQPCRAKLIDVGIGAYEYWGDKSVDSNKVWASDCCEASVFQDAELTEYWEEEAGED